MDPQTLYNQILQHIKSIYLDFEKTANEKAEAKNIRAGTKADKNEEEFLKRLGRLETGMDQFVAEMRTKGKGAGNDFREHQLTVQDCLNDIHALNRKRPLNFKVNKELVQLIEDTEACINALGRSLTGITETKIMCCGTDGAKRFGKDMTHFKISAGKWKMMTIFEPKDSFETFVAPKFSEKDFFFISKLLRDKWPQPKEVIKRVEVEVPKEVQVVREVRVGGSGGPCQLCKANGFLFGINKEENIAQGLSQYQELAQQGNPAANCFLGTVYQQGLLVPTDLKKAVDCYKKSMERGQSYASYRFAMCLIEGKLNNKVMRREDVEKGHKMLESIAGGSKTVCPEALAELGEIYEFGHFKCDTKKIYTIQQDPVKAANYFNKGRNMCLARASNNLGVLHLNQKISQRQTNSEITNQSQLDGKIMNYLQQSSQAGFSEAFYNLGMIYSKGLVGQKRSEEAMRMFYEGALKKDFKCKVKFAYELMNQTSIMKEEYEDNYHLALQWLESVVRKLTFKEDEMQTQVSQASRADRGEALFYLGLFHEHGFGVEKSSKKAMNYFIESSDLDYPAAKNKIGDCYFSGFGIKQDRQLAVGCYLQGAQLGNSDSMVNLGTIYLNGIPNLVQRSYKKAYEYFLNAHELDNSDAMIHLSYMYSNGLGVQPNQEVAKDLLEEAAQLKNATALYMLREKGMEFNEGVLFEHLQNEFFAPPKKIDLQERVPLVKSIVKSNFRG